ncbi:flagellar basal body P-ring formation chaperone FlgA [Mixta tenebrionis]|uniref:Flagella basal body P-ring formation protein FlgA n=1 Tax=Mixta tenebrionis TaxID=2562439 RepID=A0A506VHL9_9GAMM|nr:MULTISPECIES: flagellar basal body P-ring formation chaperone FlgA [Mixta]QHM75927.1 Flagella basal body P-ring formation protein FlgA [Mixta theicola]TPW44453.1 flagellar basal body P-ring formation protein FlgA [Mixta tenebrionis]
MRTIKGWLAATLLLLALPVWAEDLSAQLNQFFKARDPLHAAGINVVVRTPQAQWPACAAPQFSLPGNSRLWGLISVAASCERDRRYLQVEVQVSGDYVVVNRPIARGSALSAADLGIKQGRLDTLPARAVLDAQQIVAAVSVRDLLPDQPLTLSMVRQPWRVKAGQQVMVIAQGDGFNASGEGRALNNATATQRVRVRMGNGQIVSGSVDADGNILISL